MTHLHIYDKSRRETSLLERHRVINIHHTHAQTQTHTDTHMQTPMLQSLTINKYSDELCRFRSVDRIIH